MLINKFSISFLVYAIGSFCGLSYQSPTHNRASLQSSLQEEVISLTTKTDNNNTYASSAADPQQIANYCVPGGMVPFNTYVQALTFNEINNDPQSDPASFNSTPQGYSDFTAMLANVTPGTTYTPEFTINYRYFISQPYTIHLNCWIDLNQDDDFDDPNELFFATSVTRTTLGPNQTWVVNDNVTIPAAALLGSTRMRVICAFDLNPSPCQSGTSFWGEVEDYTLNVTSSTNVPSVTPTVINESAPGASDGAINLAINNGTAPFNFAWNSGATSQNLANITAGTYVVTVTDANNNIVSESIEVQTLSTAYCTPEGMTYWNNHIAGMAFAGINNLSQTDPASGQGTPKGYGDYTTLVGTTIAGNSYTMQANCTYNYYIATPSTLYYKAWIDLNRDGDFVDAGELVLSKTGTTTGTGAGFTFTVNDPITIPVSASIGNTRMRVAFSRGDDIGPCPTGTNNSEVEDYTITIQSGSLSLTHVATNESIPDAADGAIDLSVFGGQGPYTYAWSNGATTEDIQNLTAGDYSVTVTDNAGTIATATITIIVIDPFPSGYCLPQGMIPWYNYVEGFVFEQINNKPQADPTSFNGSPNPGYLDYSDTYVTNAQINSTYVLKADVQMGWFVANDNRTGYLKVWIDLNRDGDFDDTDELRLTRSVLYPSNTTGNVPFNFVENIRIPSTATPGATYMRVSFENGNSTPTCPTTTFYGEVEDYGIVLVADPNFVPLNITYEACKTRQGESIGAIDLKVEGGVPPYLYQWDYQNAAIPDLTGLPAGTYTVTVTDADNVTQSVAITIDAHPNYDAVWTDVPYYLQLDNYDDIYFKPYVNPSEYILGCNRLAAGQAGFVEIELLEALTGASVDEVYVGMINEAATNKEQTSSGNYLIQVQGGNGKVFELGQELNTQTFGAAGDKIKIDRDASGVIRYFLNGSTTAFYTSATNAQSLNLKPIIYILQTDTDGLAIDVTSSFNCQDLIVTIERDHPVFPETKGFVDVRVKGGTPPYFFTWSNGASSQDLEQAMEGEYTVTITDAASQNTSNDAEVFQYYNLTWDDISPNDLDIIGDSLYIKNTPDLLGVKACNSIDDFTNVVFSVKLPSELSTGDDFTLGLKDPSLPDDDLNSFYGFDLDPTTYDKIAYTAGSVYSETTAQLATTEYLIQIKNGVVAYYRNGARITQGDPVNFNTGIQSLHPAFLMNSIRNGGAVLDVKVNFPCVPPPPNMDQFATLRKQLDGHFVSLQGGDTLRFKYIEDYAIVNNKNDKITCEVLDWKDGVKQTVSLDNVYGVNWQQFKLSPSLVDGQYYTLKVEGANKGIIYYLRFQYECPPGIPCVQDN